MVMACPQSSLYCLSWYLDVVYPKWDALIWQTDDEYIAAIPLPTKEIAFFRWVEIPYYVQQTGLIYRKDILPEDYLIRFLASDFQKRYVSFNIAFASSLRHLLEDVVDASVWQKTLRKNFLLALNSPYESLFSQFNENRKRNLKKANKSGWICEATTDMGAALEMYTTFQVPFQKDAKIKAFGTIRGIYAAAQERGLAELYQVKDGKSESILAYSLFVRFENRIYFLFGATNDKGREYSASSLPFDYVIRKYAGQDITLDFEGGNLQGIGQYFASFGAKPEEYLSLSYSKLRSLIGYRK